MYDISAIIFFQESDNAIKLVLLNKISENFVFIQFGHLSNSESRVQIVQVGQMFCHDTFDECEDAKKQLNIQLQIFV